MVTLLELNGASLHDEGITGVTRKAWTGMAASGTESAASLEVTSAPAINNKIVQHTTNTQNLCTPGWYVAVIAIAPGANYTLGKIIA